MIMPEDADAAVDVGTRVADSEADVVTRFADVVGLCVVRVATLSVEFVVAKPDAAMLVVCSEGIGVVVSAGTKDSLVVA